MSQTLPMITGNFTHHNLVKVNKLVTDIDTSAFHGLKGDVGPIGSTGTTGPTGDTGDYG